MDHLQHFNVMEVQDIVGVLTLMEMKLMDHEKILGICQLVQFTLLVCVNCNLLKLDVGMDHSDHNVKMMDHSPRCNVTEVQDIAGVWMVQQALKTMEVVWDLET